MSNHLPQYSRHCLLGNLRTAWAKELSLDKNVSVYDDLIDSLRLALRAYIVK
jgi:hypothetical protein